MSTTIIVSSDAILLGAKKLSNMSDVDSSVDNSVDKSFFYYDNGIWTYRRDIDLVASNADLGLVKAGDGIIIDADGTINATGGSGSTIPEPEADGTQYARVRLPGNDVGLWEQIPDANWNTMFELIDDGGGVQHIRAKFDLVGDGEIIAYGTSAGVDPIINLATSTSIGGIYANNATEGFRGHIVIDSAGFLSVGDLNSTDLDDMPTDMASKVGYVLTVNSSGTGYELTAKAEMPDTTTDDINEGDVNLYYTDERVASNATVQENTQNRHNHANMALLNTITDSGSGTKFLSDNGTYIDGAAGGFGDMFKYVYDPDDIHQNVYDYVNFINTPDIPSDTDDISEAGNLYYTDARVSSNSDVEANTLARHTHSNKTVLDLIADSGSGSIITTIERNKLDGIENGAQVNMVLSVNGQTGNVVIDVTGSLSDLDDVSLSSPTNGQALIFNGTDWVNTSIETGGGDMTKSIYDPTGVNGDAFDYLNLNNTPLIPSTTDDITEGSNLYYTDARVSSNSDVSANTLDRHTHTNKSTLDGTEESFTTTLKNKLDGIDDGAQVNTVLSVNGQTGDVVINVSGSLTDLNDVSLSNPTNTQILTYNGTNWVNSNQYVYDDSDVLKDSDVNQTVSDTNKVATMADISDAGGGDMVKSVYDPNNVNADAFDYNNFTNTPVIPTNTDQISEGSVNLYYTETRVSANTDVSANTADRHSHTNKTILDNITSYGSGIIISDTERTKLSGIADGAEVNVNADWNSSSGDSQILNKPTDLTILSLHNATELNDITDSGSGSIITDTERTKLSGIEDGAEVNVVLSVNAKTGTVVLNAGDISYDNSNSYFTGTTVQSILDEIGEVNDTNGYELTNPDSLPSLSFDDATRTFSVSVQSGQSNYYYWANGKKITNTTTHTVVIPDVSGTYYIIFDNSNNLISVLEENVSIDNFYNNAITGLVYWNSVEGVSTIAGPEMHGRIMDARTHHYNHATYGTRYEKGFDIHGLTDGGSTFSSIDSGVVWDEDIRHTGNSQTVALTLWREGDDGLWKTNGTPTNDVGYIPSGGTYSVYNYWDGTTWSLVEGDNQHDFSIYFYLTIPNISGDMVYKLIGQNAYASVGEARGAIESEINNISLHGLPSPEFVFLYATIIKRTGELKVLDDGSLYLDLRQTKGGAGGSSTASSYAVNILTDAEQFTGNLSSTDVNVQTALETIDAMSVGSGASTYIELNDTTDEDYTGKAGQAPLVNSTEDGLTLDIVVVPDTTGTTSTVLEVWSGTQAEYDALGTYLSTTLYFIQ